MSVVQLCCRCFMSGGAPASSPSKSRVVEAVCIRLCDAITQPLADSRPDGTTRYVSRWRQVLDAYNRVRARLFNSLELLEGTDLALFAINEATLLRWFKLQERRKEVLLLQQGRPVPVEPLCSVQPLPPSQSRPSVADPLPGPHLEFPVMADTSGQAVVRRRKLPTCTATTAAPIDDGLAPMGDSGVLEVRLPAPASRTTAWRKRNAPAAPTSAKQRKVRCCQKCQQPIGSVGHSQFKGHIYCPYVPGQLPKDEWLALRRAEHAEKKAQHG